MYPVTQKLIRYNRPGKKLEPKGVVWHSTATPGADAEAEQRYFDTGNRGASVHYFVDWDSIVQTVPEYEQAWGAGPTANAMFIHVEMCETNDEKQFVEIYKRMVWLVADILYRHKLTINDLWSHDMVSRKWKESTHTDPLPYFKKWGIKWEQAVIDVENELNRRKGQENMMSKDDANKIIGLLQAVWQMIPGQESKDEIHRLADEIRKASGQEVTQ